MELIDKERVEEILRNLWKKDDGTNPEHRICYNKALQEVQCELDTIDVKEVDLEREMDKEWNKCEPIDEGMGLEIVSIEHEQFDNIAKHFYELGLNTQKGE